MTRAEKKKRLMQLAIQRDNGEINDSQWRKGIDEVQNNYRRSNGIKVNIPETNNEKRNRYREITKFRKNEYISMKEQGYLDREIEKMWNMNRGSLYPIKSEWDLVKKKA